MTHRALITACLLLVVCRAGHADAQPRPGLALSFEGCSDEDVTEIRRLVSIDLGAPTASPEASYTLSIRCGESVWQLDIPSASLTRSLDFASTAPSARARLTAIVVGELVAEASAGRAARPAEPAPPAVVPRAPPTDDRPRGATGRDRFHLGLMGGGRTLLGGVPRLLGAALRLEDLEIPWSLDVLAEQGTVTTSEGLVSVRSLSGGLSLSWQQALSSARVRAGGGLRAGAVWMQGEPGDRVEIRGQTLLRGWAGPMLTSSVTLPIARPFAFELVVEGGYTLLPVYGLVVGRREAALSGWWLGAQVGVGLGL